jgi:hypothetical protein
LKIKCFCHIVSSFCFCYCVGQRFVSINFGGFHKTIYRLNHVQKSNFHNQTTLVMVGGLEYQVCDYNFLLLYVNTFQAMSARGLMRPSAAHSRTPALVIFALLIFCVFMSYNHYSASTERDSCLADLSFQVKKYSVLEQEKRGKTIFTCLTIERHQLCRVEH